MGGRFVTIDVDVKVGAPPPPPAAAATTAVDTVVLGPNPQADMQRVQRAKGACVQNVQGGARTLTQTAGRSRGGR